MRINVLQHTPNEGPGVISEWAHQRGHEIYVYHPAQFNKLPTADETDMLVILGGPMSPNDDLPWIAKERQLIKELLAQDKPMFGACFGGQQLAMTLGATVKDAPVKEVGWAPVFLKSDVIPDLPETSTVLHWHQQMFTIPNGAQLLYSSAGLKERGFVYGHRVVGLQFHFEPLADNVREIVVNDGDYAAGSILNQTPAEIITHPVPKENTATMFKILDWINE